MEPGEDSRRKFEDRCPEVVPYRGSVPRGDASDPPAGLDAVAEELYGLVPEEFTAARDARAKAARSAGDRDLASAVRGLRRPSVAAWAVNQLVRRHADVVGQLTRLATAMREAQLSLAGAELRTLTAEQKELTALVRALVEQDADAAGVALSAAAGEQVVQTLRAAVADEDAAVAVRSGRLTTHLEHTGFGAVDLDGAVAVPRSTPLPVEPGASSEPEPEQEPEPGPSGEAERERAERERAERERTEREEAARQAVERAEREAADAAQALEEAEARAREARDAEAAAVERVHELEEQLREARAARDAAATSQHAAGAERDAAARAAREADATTQRARHHLTTLTPP